jgi:protocatechuate 3,4-dioxygenase beta subunit
VEKLTKFLLLVPFIFICVVVQSHSDSEAQSCPTELRITPILDDPIAGEPITVTGAVLDNGSIVAGAPVTFSGSGAEGLKDVQTGLDGTFSSTGASPATPGDFWIVKASTVCEISGQTDYDTLPPPSTSLVKTSLNLHSISNVNRGGQIGVSGSLIDGSQNPVSGAQIKFTGSGSHSLDSATTGDDGSFSLQGAAPTRTGTWSVQGHFDGNSKYAASDSNKRTYKTTSIVVKSPLKTSLILNAIANVKSGEQISVSGSLVDESQNPVSGVDIGFTGSGSRNLDRATTGDDGSFSLQGAAPATTGRWMVQGHFVGNSKYAASYSNRENYETSVSAGPGPRVVVSPPQNNIIPDLVTILSGEIWLVIIALVVITAIAAIAVSKLRKGPKDKQLAVVTVEIEGGKESI